MRQATNTGLHQVVSSNSFEQTSEVKVLPAAEYLRAHDLQVHGAHGSDRVPDPVQTFEGAGFPSDILTEVSSSKHAIHQLQ